ncbi:hypothetical protein ZWY2020_044084 [Hordeum vulgare]|nr:hypothetical protein ZWY2020_044084 [Hordeum vulgare]
MTTPPLHTGDAPASPSPFPVAHVVVAALLHPTPCYRLVPLRQQNSLELQESNAGHLWWSDGLHAQQHHAVPAPTQSQTPTVSGMRLQPATKWDLVISMRRML